MMLYFLAASPLDRLYGIRDRFAEGGSATSVLWVMGALLALLIALYTAMRYVQYRQRRQLNCPRRLLAELIAASGLSVRQRDMVNRIARHARLDHPATLLISRSIFDGLASQWLRDRAGDNEAQRRRVAELAQAIFAKPVKTPPSA